MIRGVPPAPYSPKPGATPSEIAAMLGWTVTKVNQMVDTYQSMSASLSDSGIAKLERKAR
jgi:hypothetical protein